MKSRTCQQLVALTAVGFVAYVTGYFAVSDYGRASLGVDAPVHVREFRNRIVRTAYWPLGWVEAEIRQESVVHASADADTTEGAEFWRNLPEF